MLYELVNFSDQISALNVFRYITFRTGGAIFTALLFVMMFGPAIIDLLRVRQGKGQPIREDGPQSHHMKRGTPTMGGLMILAGVTVSTLLWGQLSNGYIWVVLGVALSYGAIGFYDDFLKVTKRSSAGFASKSRFALEVFIAAVAGYLLMRLGPRDLSTVSDVAVLQGLRYRSRAVLHTPGRARHFRRRQRRQFDRRTRWPRHRSGHDRGRDIRRHRLPLRQRQVRRVSSNSSRTRDRRACRHLRGA